MSSSLATASFASSKPRGAERRLRGVISAQGLACALADYDYILAYDTHVQPLLAHAQEEEEKEEEEEEEEEAGTTYE